MLTKIRNHKITKYSAKVLKLKLLLFVFMLLPLAVFTFFTSKLYIGDLRSFIVVSGSMEPALGVGSVVYMKKTSDYAKGDVIAFANKSNQTVTHRIFDVVSTEDNTQYKTKGDANKNSDADLVPVANVIGKQVFYIPYLGYGINFLKTPTGFLVLIVVPTLFFIATELWAIKREIEKQVEKRVLEKLQMEKTQ